MRELDTDTMFSLCWVNVRIMVKLRHEFDFDYQTVIPKESYFMIVHSINNQPVFQTVQQLPLNRKLVRVRRENYFALRINLN